MQFKERLELVQRNTEEILTQESLNKLLKEKKSPKSYIGIAVTGPFHMGYLIPFGKMMDFDKVGIKNTILIADIHGALDDLKSNWEELDMRRNYYKECAKLAVPWDNTPRFVDGSSFQLKEDYHLDLLKISSMTTVTRATRAASEVTRMKNPKVSEMIYPIMQALDEEYLKVDIQLGGIDQRHVLGFARDYLPKIGYKARTEVMTPLVSSLAGPGTKMSASNPNSSLKVYDSEELIKKKINKAYCPEGSIKENPILELTKYFIFPVKGGLKVERDSKFGGDVQFKDYGKLQNEFANKKLHPKDFKDAVARELIKTFSKVRKHFDKKQDLLKELGENFI